MNTTPITTVIDFSPFLGSNNLYGYRDQNNVVLIEPQYLEADKFVATGFAVVKSKNGLYGIISHTNKVVAPFHYSRILLTVVNHFTIAQVVITYQVRTEFWNWKLVPNLKLGIVKEKCKAFVIENRQLITTKVYTVDPDIKREPFLPIETIGERFVCIDQDLYKAKRARLKRIVKNYVGMFDNESKIVRKVNNEKVRVCNSRGRKVQSFETIHNEVFPITYKGKEHLVYLNKKDSMLKKAPVIYRDTKRSGRYYVNHEFDMPIPVHLKVIDLKRERPLVDIWKNVISVCPVPHKHFFIIEVKPMEEGQIENDFYFMNRLGTLQDYLEDETDFILANYLK